MKLLLARLSPIESESRECLLSRTRVQRSELLRENLRSVGDADVDTMLNNGKQELIADQADLGRDLGRVVEVENASVTRLHGYMCASRFDAREYETPL